GWSPQTEAALVDAASYGNSVRDGAAAKFLEQLRDVDDEGGNRSAYVAVERLGQACLLGLYDLAGRLLAWLRLCVREDPGVPSATAAGSRLVNLWVSRGPLGAARPGAVPELARPS